MMHGALFLLAALAAASAAPLVAPSAASPIDPDTVKQDLKRAASYFLNVSHGHDTCSWTWGTFYEGVMHAYFATNDTYYLDIAVAWAEKYDWTVCEYPKTLNISDGADFYLIGAVYSQIYGIQRKSYQIANTQLFLNQLVNRSQVDDYWWIDSFFMGLPVFSELFKVTGETRLLNKMFDLFFDTTERQGLWSPGNALYFRDATYFHKTCPNGKSVFWSRGNGWAFAGLARILANIPRNHSTYDAYKSIFSTMAPALKAIQGSDGFWRASLLDPEQCPGPESTGTGMFVFGMLEGIMRGILPSSDYLQPALAGWTALSTVSLQDSGLVGWCQAVGGSPANATSTSTSEFCVGQFLLAGSAVLQHIASQA